MAQDVFPKVHTLTQFDPFLKTYQKLCLQHTILFIIELYKYIIIQESVIVCANFYHTIDNNIIFIISIIFNVIAHFFTSPSANYCTKIHSSPKIVSLRKDQRILFHPSFTQGPGKYLIFLIFIIFLHVIR